MGNSGRSFPAQSRKTGNRRTNKYYASYHGLKDLVNSQANIQGVLELVVSQGSNFNGVVCAVALNKLANLVNEAGPRASSQAQSLITDPRFHLLVDQYAVKVAGAPTAAQGQALAAMAKVGYAPSPSLMASVRLRALESLSDLKGGNLAGIVNALSKLRCAPQPVEFLDATRARLLELLQNGGDVMAMEAAMTYAGWAKMDYNPGPLVSGAVRDALEESLEALPPHWLGLTLSAMNRFRYQPGDAFLGKVVQSMLDRLDEYSPFEVGTIVSCLPRLRYEPPPGFTNTIEAAVYRRLLAYGPQPLSLVLNGLGNLNHRPEPAFLEAITESLPDTLHMYKPQELATLAVGLGKLGARPGPMVMTCLVDHLEHHLPHFKAQELANSIFALVKLDYAPGEEFMSKYQQAVQGNLPTCTGQNLAYILHGMAQFHTHPGEVLLGQICTLFESRMQGTTSMGLANVVAALADFHYHPGQHFLAKTVTYAREHAREFQPTCVANLLYGYYRLGFKPSEGLLQDLLGTLITRPSPALGLVRVMTTFAAWEFAPTKAFADMWVTQAPRKLRDLRPKEIVQAMSALRGLGFVPDSEAMEALKSNIAVNPKAFSSKDREAIKEDLMALGVEVHDLEG